jgi:hypothetical protein
MTDESDIKRWEEYTAICGCVIHLYKANRGERRRVVIAKECSDHRFPEPDTEVLEEVKDE